MSSSANPKVPSKSRVIDAAKNAGWGVVGGLGVALGTAVLGVPIGTAGAAILTGAVVGGEAGRVITINGVMDATYAAFSGN